MNYRYFLIVAALAIGCTVPSLAQQATSTQHKSVKKTTPAKKKKKLTPQEAKQEAIKRTLKEKNFHLPDTTHR